MQVRAYHILATLSKGVTGFANLRLCRTIFPVRPAVLHLRKIFRNLQNSLFPECCRCKSRYFLLI